MADGVFLCCLFFKCYATNFFLIIFVTIYVGSVSTLKKKNIPSYNPDSRNQLIILLLCALYDGGDNSFQNQHRIINQSVVGRAGSNTVGDTFSRTRLFSLFCHIPSSSVARMSSSGRCSVARWSALWARSHRVHGSSCNPRASMYRLGQKSEPSYCGL